MTVAKLLLDIFGGNPYHAQAAESKSKKGMYYRLIHEPITEELLHEHLEGEVVLGSYTVDKESHTVKYIAWDIDSPGDMLEARSIAKRIISHIEHLPYAISFSGNKGYHIYLFLETPIPARTAKEIAEMIRGMEQLPKAGNPHVECYPKQATLVGKNTGNLLKIPLGIHPTTHNRSIFIDPENGFENGVPLAPEEILKYRVSETELLALREKSQATMETLAEAISVEWDEGRRHDLCLFLSGYLAQTGWTFEQTLGLIEQVFELRPDDTDLVNRKQAVEDTYKRFNRGNPVAGFQSLSEIVSGKLMKTITNLAPILISPTIARQIDNIRFDKGPVWKKERDVANLIWNWLTDSENGGRILRVDPTGLKQEWNIYYFENEYHQLYSIESATFDDTLYRYFKLSVAEGFTSRVKGHLVRKARTEGEIAQIHQRSIYVDGILYVNLGGEEIYILNGDTIEIVPNGTDNMYFLTNNPNMVTPRIDKNVDIFDELVNDLSFETSENATIPADEQKELLKAWIIAYFFRSILPTRPILTILGLPGSGKTTAIRQVLRTLEGLDQNVVGVTSDRRDSWRAMLDTQSFIVLDNLEGSSATWLANALDLIATGQIIHLRKLYTTNEMYSIRPNAFVALTAVELPFAKETVFERMLILYMKKLPRFTPSHIIEEQLRHNIGAIWGDLLQKLNEVVAILQRTKMPKLAMEIRLADFAHFCARIRSASFFRGTVLEKGMRFLATAQQSALANAENSAYPLLLEWIENNPKESQEKRRIGKLFNILQAIAKVKGIEFHWKTNQALARHLSAMRGPLETALGMKIISEYDSNRGRKINWYTFNAFGTIKIDKPDKNADGFTLFSLER